MAKCVFSDTDKLAKIETVFDAFALVRHLEKATSEKAIRDKAAEQLQSKSL
jgi:hypothetical protein